jgi:hypothetical protein
MSAIYSPSKKKCRHSQSRNQSTGRCRKKKCSSGKTRDVSSRRCRKKKCSRGKTRDVSSRRCRKKKSVRKSPSKAARSRKQCKPGKSRSRSTGRCRKTPNKKSGNVRNSTGRKTQNYASKSISDQIRNWGITGEMFPTKSGFIPPPANKKLGGLDIYQMLSEGAIRNSNLS